MPLDKVYLDAIQHIENPTDKDKELFEQERLKKLSFSELQELLRELLIASEYTAANGRLGEAILIGFKRSIDQSYRYLYGNAPKDSVIIRQVTPDDTLTPFANENAVLNYFLNDNKLAAVTDPQQLKRNLEQHISTLFDKTLEHVVKHATPARMPAKIPTEQPTGELIEVAMNNNNFDDDISEYSDVASIHSDDHSDHGDDHSDHGDDHSDHGDDHSDHSDHSEHDTPNAIFMVRPFKIGAKGKTIEDSLTKHVPLLPGQAGTDVNVDQIFNSVKQKIESITKKTKDINDGLWKNEQDPDYDHNSYEPPAKSEYIPTAAKVAIRNPIHTNTKFTNIANKSAIYGQTHIVGPIQISKATDPSRFEASIEVTDERTKVKHKEKLWSAVAREREVKFHIPVQNIFTGVHQDEDTVPKKQYSALSFYDAINKGTLHTVLDGTGINPVFGKVGLVNQVHGAEVPETDPATIRARIVEILMVSFNLLAMGKIPLHEQQTRSIIKQVAETPANSTEEILQQYAQMIRRVQGIATNKKNPDAVREAMQYFIDKMNNVNNPDIAQLLKKREDYTNGIAGPRARSRTSST